MSEIFMIFREVLLIGHRKSTYDHARKDCVEMEGSIQGIQSKILSSMEELLGVDVSASIGLHLEELRGKMNLTYFN